MFTSIQDVLSLKIVNMVQQISVVYMCIAIGSILAYEIICIANMYIFY
jgi:hypothetical protein